MKRVLKELLIFNFIPFLIAYFFLNDIMDKRSLFFGWIIVFVGLLIGLVVFQFVFDKDNKTFLRFYFGGMIFRMFLLLLLIFVTLKFIGINPISFLFSLFIFYFINQIIELRHITKLLSDK